MSELDTPQQPSVTQPSAEVAATSAVQQRIAALVARNAHQFDPVRFRFIEAMVNRAQTHNPAVAKGVEEKALHALETYHADFEHRRQLAEVAVGRIEHQFPASYENAQALFLAGKFSSITRLEASLLRSQSQRSSVALLAALTEEVNGIVPQGDEDVTPQAQSFHSRMRQQEGDVVQRVMDSAEGETPLPQHSGALPELKSVNAFRETWAKQSSQRLVNNAIQESPEDPGPLNPQMLVTRSLSDMRDISPEYVNRYIEYLDTLLWLGAAGGEVVSR